MITLLVLIVIAIIAAFVLGFATLLWPLIALVGIDVIAVCLIGKRKKHSK